MTCSVYWIRHPDHTDMFTQGYIGITKDIKRRFRSHKVRPDNNHLKNAIKKYDWDNLIKKVILIADRSYCLEVETKLRPANQIGWNVASGGSMPPHDNVWNKGRKIPKEELADMKAKGFGFDRGHKTWNTGIKYTEEMKAKIYDIGSHTRGKPAHNKGKPALPHVREMLLKYNTGKPQSDESRYKKSLANKGRVFEEVTCPNCKKTGGLTAMKRWHFDKCIGDKMFNARTTINGKRIFLGNFATKELVNLTIEAYRKENNCG
jgi:predicted GIY-YIG superfamily endonuclease